MRNLNKLKIFGALLIALIILHLTNNLIPVINALTVSDYQKIHSSNNLPLNY